MLKLTLIVLLFASPVMADTLDDQWAICNRHRTMTPERGRIIVGYASGFEACSSVETALKARKDAEKQGSDNSDADALKSLQGK